MRRFAPKLERYLCRSISRFDLRTKKTSLEDHRSREPFTFFKLLFAAASMILRPVTVEPVNATLSTSICDASAAPPTAPSEGTVFTTPGGKLPFRSEFKKCRGGRARWLPTLLPSRVLIVSGCITSVTEAIFERTRKRKKEGNSIRTNAVSGVNSDGFMTIVQPVASAGPTFQPLQSTLHSLQLHNPHRNALFR